MKKKILCSASVFIILTSFFSTIFSLNQSWALCSFQPDNGKNSKTARDEAAETSEDFWSRLFQSSSTSNANNVLDRINFSNMNAWSKLGYLNGKNVRLVVGVEGDPTLIKTQLGKLASVHDAQIVDKVFIGGKVKAYSVELPLTSITAFAQSARNFDFVQYVEPSMRVEAHAVPNDPGWSLQWGPRKIEADLAWNTTLGNHSILVAVADTGIDYTHGDLALNYQTGGYDWANNDADPMDDHGHGTHCAGIIAAVINNSVGIAGLAQVRVMTEKVLDNWGSGYWEWVANGISHAVDQGANIISMSLGGTADSQLVRDAVEYAYENGVLVVASAGNSNSNIKSYPAGYDEVIAVAATDQNDNKASFSNWGEWIELAAPGVDVYSTVPWGYESWSGTSMACPHVSGLAALVWSLHPDRTRDWLRQWLQYTADDLGIAGFDVQYGYGRINARNSVEKTPPEHELIATGWTTPPYLEPNASGQINVSILNFGDNNETNVTVALLVNGTTADSISISSIPKGSSGNASLTWETTVAGFYNVTAYVVPSANETNVQNNALWKYIYVGFPRKAVVLHSSGNLLQESITNWQVLSNEWYRFGNEAVYVDYTSLNKDNISYEDLTSTEADVLIISCAYDSDAGWEFTNAEIDAIEAYVQEGHGLIATAGTLYEYVPNNNKLGRLFGLNESVTWSATMSDLFHLVNASHPLFTEVPSPFIFPYSGVALSTDGQWDSNELAGGTYVALGEYLESAIVAYRGLVYIASWPEIVPAYYKHPLQLLYNAITWSSYKKPAHDLSVSLQCPIHLDPGQSAWINAAIKNTGLNDETDVTLRLLINSEQVANLTLSNLNAGESETLSFFWQPADGSYNVTAYALPMSGEEELQNNQRTVYSQVRYAAVIGFIETHGESLHSEDLKAYYEDRGEIVVTIHSMLTSELLADFDILIVGEDWSGVTWLPSEIDAVKNFIKEGKGFVAIGDELTSSVMGIINEYGMRYSGYGGNSGRSDNLNSSHPIMEGVEYIYAESPINSLYTTVPGYWIANDAYDTYMLIAGAEFNGYVVCMSEDFAALLNNEDNSLMFANLIAWMATVYEHELVVSVETFPFVLPNSTVVVNGTVRNRGATSEFNVSLQLFIDGALIRNTIVPQLMPATTFRLNFSWTPQTEGTYNITAYAQPVENETHILNNQATRLVRVTHPLINPVEGQYANYTGYMTDYYGNKIHLGWDFEYHYHSPYSTNVTTLMTGYGNVTQVMWMTVDIFTRIIEDSGSSLLAFPAQYYFGWIETNITIGSTVKILIENGTVVRTKFIVVNARPIECWEIRLDMSGYTYTFWYDKVSGLLIAMEFPTASVTLVATNIPISATYEHDLATMVDVPLTVRTNKNTTIDATVYNVGLHEETNITLQLIINESVVASKTTPSLAANTTDTLSYSWRPEEEGTYNVTAFVSFAPSETYLANNVASVFVEAVELGKYVLFDQTHGADNIIMYSSWTTLLAQEGYFIETHESGPITSDVLQDCAVFAIPQARTSYTIDEINALHNFVREGGSLLVIGDAYPAIYASLTSFAGMSWLSGGSGGYMTDFSQHPITNGLTGLYFSGTLSYISVDSSSLGIVRDGYGYVMVAAAEIGFGKIVSLADSDSVNNFNINWYDNRFLAVNMIEWLATKDVIMPSVTIIDPVNATLTKETNMLVRWNGIDAKYGMDHYSVYVNGVRVAHDVIGESWTISVMEGACEVIVVGYNKAGNSASDKITIFVDFTPPIAYIISPANGTYHQGMVQIEFTCNDSRLEQIMLRIDGTTVATYYEVGSHMYMWNAASINGQCTISLTAFDEAGNIGQTQIQVIVDNIPPTGSLIAPTENAHIGGLYAVSVLLNDTNFERAELVVDGMVIQTETEVGSHMCLWNTTATTDGEHSIELILYDKAGNTFETAIPVVVDNVCPQVTINSPAASANLSGTVTISFSATDANLNLTFLYIDTTAVNVTGLTSYDWNSTSAGDGEHVIRLVAIDKAGNTAETQTTVNTVNLQLMKQQLDDLEQFTRQLEFVIVIFAAITIATLVYLAVFKRKKTTTQT
jgi:thermitase